MGGYSSLGIMSVICGVLFGSSFVVEKVVGVVGLGLGGVSVSVVLLVGVEFVSYTVGEWSGRVDGSRSRVSVVGLWYLVTGLHASQVVIGLVIWSVVVLVGSLGVGGVGVWSVGGLLLRATSTYWQLVDGVWVGVVLAVYVYLFLTR